MRKRYVGMGWDGIEKISRVSEITTGIADRKMIPSCRPCGA